MTLRKEQDLQNKAFAVNPLSPRAQAQGSTKRMARHAAERLRISMENESDDGRRHAARTARAFWEELPKDLQDSEVYLLSGSWNCHFLASRVRSVDRVARVLSTHGKAYARPSIEAEGLLAHGVCRLARGDFKGAVSTLELSKAMFSSTGENQLDVVRVSLPLAAALRLDGDRGSAAAVLRRARLICLEHEDAPLLGGVCLNLGNITVEEGDLASAHQLYKYSRNSSIALKSKKRQLRGELGLALASIRMGDATDGAESAQCAFEVADSLGLARERSLAAEYLGVASEAGGDLHTALAWFTRSLRIARASGMADDIVIEVHRWLAELWITAGNQRYALLHLAKARPTDSSPCDAEDRLALRRLEAEATSLTRDTHDVVRRLLDHARDVAQSGYGYEHLLTARSIVRVADRLGKHELAEEWWARTEFLAESCGALPLLARWREEREARTSDQGAETWSEETPGNTESDEDTSWDELPRIDLEAHGIITQCRSLQDQASWIARLAPTKVPVLIRGQSGTGKELFARLVHQLSPRKKSPFLAINCGALPAEIIESELFGHRRGAFTGAITDKPGLFREAHTGTLFLDEIGEMSGAAQAKLLRVLETGELRPVGGVRSEQVDVRTVAATNVDLERAVEDGRFRKDLYYRLKGLEIDLPPLRDRLADVPLLARHFLGWATEAQGKTVQLPFETIQWLMGQPWPGNIRELKLAMERAVALAPPSGTIHPRHFVGLKRPDPASSLPDELEEIERARVRNALDSSDWNTAAAARLLGMSRTTLAGRMKRLGIKRPRDGRN